MTALANRAVPRHCGFLELAVCDAIIICVPTPLTKHRKPERIPEGFDAVVVATGHDAIDYQAIADHASLIVDTRNVFGRLGVPKRQW
ncbi:hypothetical protein [Mesorhizobium sp.]|uniref:hypothetical protein n=1 Tax=Mesorhizobium sp. TaxID=1871066 RepID=UPI0025FD0A74|nr:hypothetical protein [Mesorhizobium sp.]